MIDVLAIEEAMLARYALWGLAAAAVGYGIYRFMKQQPPGEGTGVFFGTGR